MCQHCELKTNAVRRAKNVDPTGTTKNVREWDRAFEKRWSKLIKAIIKKVEKENFFDIGPTTNARDFKFTSSKKKAKAFMTWVGKEIDRQLLDGKSKPDKDGRWWGSSFINIAYRKGLLGAVSQIKRAGGRVADSYIASALLRGQHAKAMGIAYRRAFDALKGINEEMSNQIGVILAEGLAKGKTPDWIANKMADRVDKIGRSRAHLITRTELVSAFNEAELNSYEDAAIQGVGLRPELLTAGDDRVCPKCEAASQKKWTVETARGVIPLHPRCRCAWMPLIVNGKEIELS